MPKKTVLLLFLLGLACLFATRCAAFTVAHEDLEGFAAADAAASVGMAGVDPTVADAQRPGIDVNPVLAQAPSERGKGAGTDRSSLTTRTHTLHLEQLTPSADQIEKEVVLVSIADRTILHVPASELNGTRHGRHKAEDDFLVFDEDFDPLWYYVMKERDFTDVEWSGCGGKWRPEWSLPFHGTEQDEEAEFPSAASLEEAGGFALLKHYLSHHVVCSFSCVSFCSSSAKERQFLHPRKESGANFESKNKHFQWAAQFISTLTSSPLSFTVDTPRHIRPAGVVLATGESSATTAVNLSSSAAEPWCSYHLVYHDTLCTQQISPLLQQGKYHKELKEESMDGLPKKLIFNNVIASLFDFFSTPFHHFHFSVRRTTSKDGSVDIEVVTRMTFVVDDEKQVDRLVHHWKQVLHQHENTEEQRRLFERFSVFIGPGGVPKAMRKGLPEGNIKLDLANAATQQAAAAAAAMNGGRTWSSAVQPEVTYEVKSIGKDHGYVSVYLNPARTFFQERQRLDRYTSASGEQNAPLRAGDAVRTLMLFPLHLLRPRFYNMESFLGQSVLENFQVDKDSNTLLVVVRTPITEDHVRAFNASFTDTPVSRQSDKPNPHEQNHEHPLLLLARFQFQHGWGALKDVPRDANRFSIVPQPVVKIERQLPVLADIADVGATAREQTTNGEEKEKQCAAVCDSIGFVAEVGMPASHTPFIDHEMSLLKMMRALTARSLSPVPTAPANYCTCHRILRSALSAGSFLPSPDAAMVFNVLALGLTFASLAMSFFFRSFRKLNCRSKDLLFVENGDLGEETCEQRGELNHKTKS